MAVAVLLASGVLPSLGYIHHIGQYAPRCLPSCCSTRICPLGPYTSSYCTDYGIWRVMSFLQNQLPYLGIVGNAQTISVPQGSLLILAEFPCSTFLHLFLNFIYLFVSYLILPDSVL